MQEQNVANIPLAKTQGDAKNTSRTSGQKHRNIREAMEMAMHAIFLLCGVVAVGFVLLISIYLIVSGIPAIREVGLVDFLFGQRWAPTNKQDPAYGILPFILTSIYGTAGAVADWFDDSDLSFQMCISKSCRYHPYRCGTAGRYSIGCIWFGRYDRTGSDNPRDV